MISFLSRVPGFRLTSGVVCLALALGTVGAKAADIEEGLPIKSLIFPFYAPTAVAALEPMKRTDALRMIQEAGYDVQDSLDTGRVVELVEWIKGVDCYRMDMSSLSEGVSLIGGLLD